MESSISQIDPNFLGARVEQGLCYQRVEHTAAVIHGLLPLEEGYARARHTICQAIGPEISVLNRHNSGGRIRFRTNSPRLGVRAHLLEDCKMPHMPLSGSSSVDVFTGSLAPLRYTATLRPDNHPQEIDGQVTLSGGWETVTLYLPLYNGVLWLELGIEEGSALEEAPAYTHPLPVVFYGSSITQGGCASRPGNNYPAMVCRALDSEFTNLGYSGRAKGEPVMADYIASLSMRCLVYDYDHNAPDGAYLRETHQPFLQRILEKQPRLPVILLTRPDPVYSREDYERRDAVLSTYQWAFSQGYQVHFLDGWALFGTAGRDCCTVDGCHPNDLGFYRMAEGVYSLLDRILNHPIEGGLFHESVNL